MSRLKFTIITIRARVEKVRVAVDYLNYFVHSSRIPTYSVYLIYFYNYFRLVNYLLFTQYLSQFNIYVRTYARLFFMFSYLNFYEKHNIRYLRLSYNL